MNSLKKNKGITLIALIITVIVLVILAAISIRAVYNMKIVNYATNGTRNYIEAAKKERNIFEEVENLFKPEDGIYIGGNKVLPPIYVYDEIEFLLMLSYINENNLRFFFEGICYSYSDFSVNSRDTECLNYLVKKGLMDEKVVNAFKTVNLHNSNLNEIDWSGVYSAPQLSITKTRRLNVENWNLFYRRIWRIQ